MARPQLPGVDVPNKASRGTVSSFYRERSFFDVFPAGFPSLLNEGVIRLPKDKRAELFLTLLSSIGIKVTDLAENFLGTFLERFLGSEQV